MTSILSKLIAASDAIQAGKSLKDPAKWKNVQLLMNPFLVFVGIIPQFLPIELSSSQENAIAYGLATLAVVVNSYFTVATTDKIGLKR